MKTTPYSTAVALLRVSTPDQKLGLDAQRHAIERFAADHDIEVMAWHTEVVSGGAEIDQRVGLMAACDDVARLSASHLIVAKRDRFSRDPLTCMLTERTLAKMGATVIAADGNNETDPASELLRHILDGVARFERRMIGIRTKAALAARVAQGLPIGRPPGAKDLKPRKRAAPVAAALLLAASLAGCGLPIDYSKVVAPPKAAAAAIAQIEKDWKMPEKPEVYWYGSAFLDCGDGTGYKDSTGTCVGGDQANGQIIVALTGDPEDDVLNDGDLVNLIHEMGHEASDEIEDSGCADHKCHWFRYTDDRPLLMEGMSPVYDGGDTDIEAFHIRSLESE